MDPQTKWLLKQPLWWIQLVINAMLCAVAAGLVPEVGTIHRVIAGIIALANQYGVTKAHLTPPPRVPLIDMSADQRERVFDQNPGVRERFYAEHPELDKRKPEAPSPDSKINT